MPKVPINSVCAELGCKQPRSRFNGYCIDHGGRDTFDYKKHNQSQSRKDFNHKYATKHWRTLRQVQLSQHPLCAGCLSDGRIVPAQHVDHLFPWSQIGEHAFYRNIFQSLCQPCHSSKTHLEQKGIYRRYGTPTKDFLMSDYVFMCAAPNEGKDG